MSDDHGHGHDESIHDAEAPVLPSLAVLTQHRPEDSVEVTLLRQWMHWWATNDEAPSKVAGGLHTRTAVFLARHDGHLDEKAEH